MKLTRKGVLLWDIFVAFVVDQNTFQATFRPQDTTKLILHKLAIVSEQFEVRQSLEILAVSIMTQLHAALVSLFATTIFFRRCDAYTSLPDVVCAVL